MKYRLYNGTTKSPQELQVGDVLMGLDYQPKTIKDIKDTITPVYTVNNTFSLGLNQCLCLGDGDKKFYYVTVNDYLHNSDHYKNHKGIRYKTFIPNSKSMPIDPYVLGSCILNSYEYKGKLCLVYYNKDFDTYTLSNPFFTKDNEDNYVLSPEFFKEYYIYLNKKEFPPDMIHYNHNDIIKFLKGILDTHADYDESLKLYTFTTEQGDIVKQIKCLLNIVGITYEYKINTYNISIFPEPLHTWSLTTDLISKNVSTYRINTLTQTGTQLRNIITEESNTIVLLEDGVPLLLG